MVEIDFRDQTGDGDPSYSVKQAVIGGRPALQFTLNEVPTEEERIHLCMGQADERLECAELVFSPGVRGGVVVFAGGVCGVFGVC